MKLSSYLFSSIVFVLLFAFVSNVKSQDRLFTSTYQSGVLNKGQREIEIWNTYRYGKTDFFSRIDNRTELEIGLGHNLQTSLYLNLTTKSVGVDNAGVKSIETEHELSFSNEWKYKLFDAVADPMGLALYGEIGIGTLEREYEAKVIVDKKLNKFTLAANATYELESEAEYELNKVEWKAEHQAELNLALAYEISPKFQITMEHAYRNVFVEGKLKHSALYSGLGFSYSRENFWVNFTAMPQIKGFKGNDNNTLNLDEYEKIQCRLLASFAF
ncbi:MAG: hypothetical protein ACOYOT_00525 [Bacteroidales bacterium]